MKSKLRFNQETRKRKIAPPHIEIYPVKVKCMPKCYLCQHRFLQEISEIVVVVNDIEVGRVCPDCFGNNSVMQKAQLPITQGNGRVRTLPCLIPHS